MHKGPKEPIGPFILKLREKGALFLELLFHLLKKTNNKNVQIRIKQKNFKNKNKNALAISEVSKSNLEVNVKFS